MVDMLWIHCHVGGVTCECPPTSPLCPFLSNCFFACNSCLGSSLDLLRILHSTGIAWFTDMELLFWRRGRLALPF